MQTHISYSEISDWRQCKLKHRLGWVDRWRKTEPADALTIGTLWHEIMEAHYAYDGDKVAELLEQGESIEGGLLEGIEVGHAGLLNWMFDGYLDHYKPDGLDDFEVVANEETWLIELPDPRTEVTHLKVKLDLLIEDDDGFAVMDHKSGKNRLKPDTLELDPQFAFYVWAARSKGHDVKRAIRSWSCTKKLKRDMTLEERFERHTIRFTPTMVDRAIADLQDDLELMAQMRDTRSPSGDCSWKCSFREACLASYRRPKLEVPVLLETGHEQDMEKLRAAVG